MPWWHLPSKINTHTVNQPPCDGDKATGFFLSSYIAGAQRRETSMLPRQKTPEGCPEGLHFSRLEIILNPGGCGEGSLHYSKWLTARWGLSSEHQWPGGPTMLCELTPGLGPSAESAWTSLDLAKPAGLMVHSRTSFFYYSCQLWNPVILALILSQIEVKCIWQIFIEALKLLL